MTHDIDVYCLTVIAYQIICTEMLGALDANLRNQNKISSAPGSDIREDLDVSYASTGSTSGDDSRTKLTPKMILRGYHDVLPLKGLPKSSGGFLDRPDESTAMTIGVSSVLLEQLKALMPNMTIETPDGIVSPAAYLRTTSSVFSAGDLMSGGKLRKQRITMPNETEKDQSTLTAEDVGVVSSSSRLTAREEMYRRHAASMYS